MEDVDVESTNIDEYEFEIYFNESLDSTHIKNTTSVYLSSNDTVKSVHMIRNTKRLEVVPMEQFIRSGETITNVVTLVEPVTKNEGTVEGIEILKEKIKKNDISDVEYNISKEVIRGREHIFIDFEEKVTGFVAYTLVNQGRQNYVHTVNTPSVVRIILPESYTTGNRVLGYPRPTYDSKYEDDKGRKVLTWYKIENNSDDFREIITIGFYEKSAPLILTYVSIMILMLSFAIITNYYKNKRKRNDLQDEIK
ncbi:hypothetical protein J2T59_000515 [Methanosalsum natronophilum]|nr:hypothetical protein [Methanosalsum natronophilum]